MQFPSYCRTSRSWSPHRSKRASARTDRRRDPHEKFVEPTLYSDRAEVTEGEFSVTYHDRQPYDRRGPPGGTQDSDDLNTRFTDPAGNEYELDFDLAVMSLASFGTAST
jgi:hypothetical protein